MVGRWGRGGVDLWVVRGVGWSRRTGLLFLGFSSFLRGMQASIAFVTPCIYPASWLRSDDDVGGADGDVITYHSPISVSVYFPPSPSTTIPSSSDYLFSKALFVYTPYSPLRVDLSLLRQQRVRVLSRHRGELIM